jgi:hypothetical protein
MFSLVGQRVLWSALELETTISPPLLRRVGRSARGERHRPVILEGDLRDEVAIGCPGDTFFGPSFPGRVELYPGAEAVGTLDAHDAAAVYHGSSPYDRVGWVLTADADLTGDGLADLVVGAPRADDGGEDGGAVYLLTAPLW